MLTWIADRLLVRPAAPDGDEHAEKVDRQMTRIEAHRATRRAHQVADQWDRQVHESWRSQHPDAP